MSVGSALMGTFNSFMMNVFFWILIIGAILFGCFYWYSRFVLYKYQFLEIASNGNIIRKKARLVKDEKNQKRFQIKGWEDRQYWLQLKEPQGFFNGRACRVVAWDGSGNLVYVNRKGIEIDKTEYLKTALTTVERSEAYDGIMESIRRQNPLTKQQKVITFSIITFAVIVMIGNIMMAKYMWENAGSLQVSTDNMVEINKQLNENSKVIAINNNIMYQLVSEYTGKNITISLPTS